jgi:uncharacterized membrane protein YvbJ
MNIKCPRCGVKGQIVNNKCNVCEYEIDATESASSKKKIYFVSILTFVALILIGFIFLKSSIRDTSSPSKAYVGHWMRAGTDRYGMDEYVKSNGTMTTIYTDGTKVLGRWTVTSESIKERTLGISWTNAGSSEHRSEHNIIFSEDFKSFFDDVYSYSGGTFIYVDSKTSP